MAYKVGRPKKDEIRGYKGNDALKKVNTQIEWSEELVNEFTKCATDVKYFIENYVKIETNASLENLILRDYQHRMVDSIIDHKYTIMLCSRQVGKCSRYDEIVTLKNKKTGEISKISFKDFYKLKSA